MNLVIFLEQFLLGKSILGFPFVLGFKFFFFFFLHRALLRWILQRGNCLQQVFATERTELFKVLSELQNNLVPENR